LKAVKLYHRGKVDKVAITVSAKKVGIPMGVMMDDFLMDEGVRERDILVDLRGGNTAGETDVFLRLAERHFGRRGFRPVAVSTWYHIPRIVWLWLVRGWIPRVGISWREAHWADLRIEPFKILKSLLHPLRSSKQIDPVA
jgi:vancomycin permeability regulator SanA